MSHLKLTDEVLRSIIQSVRHGSTLRDACLYHDVSGSSFHDHIKRKRKWRKMYENAVKWRDGTDEQKRLQIAHMGKSIVEKSLAKLDPEDVKWTDSGLLKAAGLIQTAPNLQVNTQVNNQFNLAPVTQVEFVSAGDVKEREKVIEAEYVKRLESGEKLEDDSDSE